MAAIVMMAAASAAAGKPSPPAGVPVFSDGESGYEAFRIPGIAVAKGVVVVVAEGRKYGCGDFAGQHDIVLKRSTDGGKTFGDLTVVADPGKLWPSQCPGADAPSEAKSCEFWDPTPVFDSHTGDVLLLATRSWPHGMLSTVQSRMDSQMDAWVWRSSDLGVTWSQPVNLTSQLWSDAWHQMTPSNGHAIQTSTGRLLVSGYVRNGNGSQFSATFYSDDHGATWHFAAHSMVGPGTSESEVVELQRTPGTLMFNHRGGSGTGTGQHVRYQSYSTDDGLTWHGFKPVPAQPDPFCKGGIAAWPRGKGLLFTNSATTSKRVNITLRLSLDDGKTWPHAHLVSEPGGYTDVALLEDPAGGDDDVACVVYEADTCNIRLATVPVKTLVASGKFADQ